MVNMVDVLSFKNEYRILKSVETTIRKDEGRMKKKRGNEPIQVMIHIYMEMS
jgi:hypothetical protein